MATLPYPFLRRSRCGVLKEVEGLRSPEDRTDAILLRGYSAMQATVGDAASPQEEVVRQFTITTNACEVQTALTIKRKLLFFSAGVPAPVRP